MTYLKLWKQTASSRYSLELTNRKMPEVVYHLSDHASDETLTIISGILSDATIINQETLYVFGRIITLSKISDVVKTVMKSRLLGLFEGEYNRPIPHMTCSSYGNQREYSGSQGASEMKEIARAHGIHYRFIKYLYFDTISHKTAFSNYNTMFIPRRMCKCALKPPLYSNSSLP